MTLPFAGSGTHLFAITPSDTVALPFQTKEIYVGGTGDLAVRAIGDTSGSVVFKAVPVGTRLEVAAYLVLATGTTATNLVGIA